MMSHILSLISNPAEAALSAAATSAVRDAAADLGLVVEKSGERWLAPGIAWEAEIRLPPQSAPREIAARLRNAVAAKDVDINLLPAAGRRKRLLIADMDSTIIEQECLDEIAAFAGVKDQVAAITKRAMAGDLNFESALKERVGLLKGLNADILNRVFAEKITLTPGARTLVQTMSAHGAVTTLVSGGFTFFTSRVARDCGFRFHFANDFDMEDGVLTGRVVEPILGKRAKLDALRRLTRDNRLKPVETLAVGDGANDRDMIVEAGLGVAFHGKPILCEAADAEIAHGDLTALLFLQGYSSTEFSGGE